MNNFYTRSSKYFSMLAVLILISASALAQSTTRIMFESFPSASLPAGWRTAKDGGNSWSVKSGAVSMGGTIDDAALNIVKRNSNTVSTTASAHTDAIRLFPNVTYTISFFHRFNGGTNTNYSNISARINLTLNTKQDNVGATTIASPIFEGQPDWLETEYTFTVSTEGNYFIGLTAAQLAGALDFSIDDILITSEPVRKFYNKSGQDLTLLSSWGTSRDGSGIQPTNMSNIDQVFYITNYESGSILKLSKDLAVTGTGSKVILGNGTAPVTLELTEGKTITAGIVEATNRATIFLNTPVMPAFGISAPQSTIVLGAKVPAEIIGNAVFGNVTFETGKKNTLSKSILIQGKLELRDSKLELGNYDLELGFDGSIVSTSATNYVVINGKGRLRKAIRPGSEATLPAGSATTYLPVKLRLAAGSAEDVFSLGMIDGVYNSYTNDVPDLISKHSGKTVNRTWFISEDVVGGSDLTVTLSWDAADAMPGFDPNRCHVKHYENGAWDTSAAVKATLSGSTYSISRSGIKSFSPFTVSSEENTMTTQGTLPVELVSFTAKAISDAVQLNWATATEQDNDFFAVERSANGREFNTIASIESKGTTSVRTNYSFTDSNPLSGVSYYRLRQVDTDGTFKYLPVVAVTRSQAQALTLNLYPNPAQGSAVNLQVQGLAQGEAAQLKITDMVGKTVLEQALQSAEATIATAGTLRAGTYIVTIASKSGLQSKKLVIR